MTSDRSPKPWGNSTNRDSETARFLPPWGFIQGCRNKSLPRILPSPDRSSHKVRVCCTSGLVVSPLVRSLQPCHGSERRGGCGVWSHPAWEPLPAAHGAVAQTRDEPACRALPSPTSPSPASLQLCTHALTAIHKLVFPKGNPTVFLPATSEEMG